MPIKLKTTLENLDDLPEAFHDLYTEKGDSFVLTGIEGMKTQSDVDAVRRSLEKERTDHKTTKERYRPFESFADDAEAILSKLDRFDELEAAAAGKLDDDKINEMVESRMKSKTAPLERQLQQVTKERDDLLNENGELKEADKRRVIRDKIRESAVKSKMLEPALEDALLLGERVFDLDETGNVVTRDNVGVTPGVDPDVWLSEMQPKRAHWWPQSQGGGARGSGGGGSYADNPFSFENWNRTKQAQLYKADPKKAEQYAQAAGTTVNGGKPAPRSQ